MNNQVLIWWKVTLFELTYFSISRMWCPTGDSKYEKEILDNCCLLSWLLCPACSLCNGLPVSARRLTGEFPNVSNYAFWTGLPDQGSPVEAVIRWCIIQSITIDPAAGWAWIHKLKHLYGVSQRCNEVSCVLPTFKLFKLPSSSGHGCEWDLRTDLSLSPWTTLPLTGDWSLSILKTSACSCCSF